MSNRQCKDKTIRDKYGRLVVMNWKSDIAILFFSRSVKRESNTKRWTKDPTVNAQISQRLINNTLDKLKQSPFPVFYVDEKKQRGHTFGEKLSSGFQYVFDQGYQYVIAVGNDCANLKVDWHQLARQLHAGKNLIGPDKRGGVYLIGISSKDQYQQIFSEISWHGSKVFDQLKASFKNIFCLHSAGDINTLEDVIVCKALFDQIRSLLFRYIKSETLSPGHQNLALVRPKLRAPPEHCLHLGFA